LSSSGDCIHVLCVACWQSTSCTSSCFSAAGTALTGNRDAGGPNSNTEPIFRQLEPVRSAVGDDRAGHAFLSGQYVHKPVRLLQQEEEEEKEKEEKVQV